MARVTNRDESSGQFVSPRGSGAPWAVGQVPEERRDRKRVPLGKLHGGVSVVGIDPGKTTGLAVWDAWDGVWYVDQLDAGRGRKVRHLVHGGIIESHALVDGADELGVRLSSGIQVVRGGGRKSVLALESVVERNVVTTLVDVLMAVGPRAVVVVEDFVPGVAGGQGLKAIQMGRHGLSPVRIAARLMDRCEWTGIWNGDAWREFDCGWWSGGDAAAVTVVAGGVPDFRTRLTEVEAWRLGQRVARTGSDMVVWKGPGAQLELRMPHERLWLAKSEKEHNLWMRERDWWLTGCPHAMVAMQHAYAVGRHFGLDDLSKPERVWFSAAKIRPNRVSAKAR